jgi:hypothetical protein
MRGCTGAWRCEGVHNFSGARARAHAGGSATAVDRSGGARQDGPKKQETRQAPTRARNDGGGTCKIASQPSTKAGITQRKRGGVAADLAFPIGSKAGASTDEWGRTVLT